MFRQLPPIAWAKAKDPQPIYIGEIQDHPTPGEFPTLQAGDAVNFGIFREDRDTANDTCDQELGIAGISIVYTTP